MQEKQFSAAAIVCAVTRKLISVDAYQEMKELFAFLGVGDDIPRHIEVNKYLTKNVNFLKTPEWSYFEPILYNPALYDKYNVEEMVNSRFGYMVSVPKPDKPLEERLDP